MKTAANFESQLIGWRHHLHRHPELGFQEVQTSEFVAGKLSSMGLDVHRGIGGTGIVANLKVGSSESVVGIRADMDALPISEVCDRPYASISPGKMHACGHDGHMTMVLGAAEILSSTRDFNGTVRFIFQPAEEHGKGAKAMIADGLFDRFPVDSIYGAHNIPGMAAGHFATRPGGIMASEDLFEIRIKGNGMHAARPHTGIDSIVIGSQVVMALQTIISRNVDPSLSAVISCTEFITDGIRNAVPTHVTIKGDTRSYSPEVQKLLESRMRDLSYGICAMHGATCEFDYTPDFSPTVNWPQPTTVAAQAARNVVGDDHVDESVQPLMVSEDFGAFLEHVPGNFVLIGNGAVGKPGSTPLHNASYDFNDNILVLGAKYFSEVVRISLPR